MDFSSTHDPDIDLASLPMFSTLLRLLMFSQSQLFTANDIAANSDDHVVMYDANAVRSATTDTATLPMNPGLWPMQSGSHPHPIQVLYFGIAMPLF